MKVLVWVTTLCLSFCSTLGLIVRSMAMTLADEWQNFLERIGLTGRTVDTKVDEKNEEVILQLRLWASYRGQTLARTGVCRSPSSGYRANWRLNPPILLQNFWWPSLCVAVDWLLFWCAWSVRGMMYYKRALELQAAQEGASTAGWTSSTPTWFVWCFGGVVKVQVVSCISECDSMMPLCSLSIWLSYFMPLVEHKR